MLFLQNYLFTKIVPKRVFSSKLFFALFLTYINNRILPLSYSFHSQNNKEEVIMTEDQCKCGSGKPSNECCGPCVCGSGKSGKECCSQE